MCAPNIAFTLYMPLSLPVIYLYSCLPAFP